MGPAALFDLVGRVELGLLLGEGLRPEHTLVDFGCGTGRLAVHVIPYLHGGHYIGIDVSRPMLDGARRRVARVVPAPPARVSWIQQTRPVFPLPDRSVDVICAFSVFTHVEHEDTYRYLADARRIIRPDGRFVFSCLPLSLPIARTIFLREAGRDFRARWAKVRDVATSVDLMEAIARLAGWTPVRWYAGDRANIRMPETGELSALGQSTCVLEPGPAPAPATVTLAPGEAGRIVLRWTDRAVVLEPCLDAPSGDAAGATARVAPPADGTAVGALDRPPFAQARARPGEGEVTFSVSRLLPGRYRFTVSHPVAAGADLFVRAGASVTLHHDSLPAPAELPPPPGPGRRWNVFAVDVDAGGRPHLRIEGGLEEAS